MTELGRTLSGRTRVGRSDGVRSYKYVPFADRLERYTEKVDGHWLWTRSRNNRGYGVTSVGGRRMYAHRAAYELLVGPIPEGLTIDHLCRLPACVNPEHLEPVTMAENIRRGVHWASKKTHCPRGHEYAGWNVGIARRRNGHTFRFCRTCCNARARAKWRVA